MEQERKEEREGEQREPVQPLEGRVHGEGLGYWPHFIEKCQVGHQPPGAEDGKPLACGGWPLETRLSPPPHVPP